MVDGIVLGTGRVVEPRRTRCLRAHYRGFLSRDQAGGVDGIGDERRNNQADRDWEKNRHAGRFRTEGIFPLREIVSAPRTDV